MVLKINVHTSGTPTYGIRYRKEFVHPNGHSHTIETNNDEISKLRKRRFTKRPFRSNGKTTFDRLDVLDLAEGIGV